MAIEQILNSLHPDFLPKDEKTKQYIRVKDFSQVDNVSVKFNGFIAGARQQVYTTFHFGRGIEIFNRQNGSNEYRLRVNKPISTDPNTFPTAFVVEFELLKNGAVFPTIPMSVDVGEHTWVGVRFTTRDTIVFNKVLINIEYCTDRDTSWKSILVFNDESADLWNSVGEYGWALTVDTSDLSQYPKDVSIDGWVIQRYSSTNNDVPLYYAMYTAAVPGPFIFQFENISSQFDGIATVFYVNNYTIINPASTIFSIDGVPLTYGVDFSVTNVATGEITVTIPAPAATSVGRISYESSEAKVWNIKHTLGSYPSVRTFDTSDQEIYGDVVYVDANNIEITFSSPQTGAAQLSSGDSIFIPGTGFVSPNDANVITLPLIEGFEDVQWAELDTTLPTVVFTLTPPPVVAYGNPVTFSYIGADNLLVIGYEYRLNGDNFVFTDQTTLVIPAEHLILGTNTFSVRSIDDSDNASALSSYSWQYPDVTPPTTTILTGPANASLTFLDYATFTFTGTDDLGIDYFEYQLDTGGWIALGSGVTTVTVSGLALGTHLFEVRAVDFSANVDLTPDSRTWDVYTFATVPDLVHWLDFTDQSTMNSGYSTYIHEQQVAALVWTITHNLSTFPGITTVDLLGNRVYGSVTYIDNNTATVTFGLVQDGFAYINTGIFTHTQGAASTTWTINHGLGTFPYVTTVDNSGNEIFGTVTHVDNNNVQITFFAPEDGVAYLNEENTQTYPFAATLLVSIPHNQNEYPSVTIVDAVGDEIFGTVVYNDANNITVSFGAVETGNIYLNSSSQDNTIEILEITEKSVNAKIFTTAGVAETGPKFIEDLEPALPIVLGGADFSVFSDVLQDTTVNAAISGNELTVAFIVVRDGDDPGSVLYVTGATDYFLARRDSGGTRGEFFLSTAMGGTDTAIPEAPYLGNGNIAFCLFRINPAGYAQAYINGKFIGQQEVYPGWTLGANSTLTKLGFLGTSSKVFYTVMYDRYLTDLEVSNLYSAYSILYTSLNDLMVSEFAGVGGIGNADTGQTWVESLGTTARDGAGLLEVTAVPSFDTVALTSLSNYVVVINGLTLLNNDNDNYLVFRAKTGFLTSDYYRVKVENTFSASNNIVLERVVSGVPSTIDSVAVPWTLSLGNDAVINVSIGVQGNTVSYGASLSVSPTFEADGATAWTGIPGTATYNYATIPALVFGEDNFGMSFGTTGIKMDVVRVLNKV